MSSIAYIGLNPGTKNTYVHSEHDAGLHEIQALMASWRQR